MTSKEAYDLLVEIQQNPITKTLVIDADMYLDFVRLGLLFGEVQEEIDTDTKQGRVKLYVTLEGKQRIRDEQAFCDWWDKMQTLPPNMYTEDFVRNLYKYTMSRTCQAAISGSFHEVSCMISLPELIFGEVIYRDLRSICPPTSHSAII